MTTVHIHTYHIEHDTIGRRVYVVDSTRTIETRQHLDTVAARELSVSKDRLDCWNYGYKTRTGNQLVTKNGAWGINGTMYL